MEKLLTAKEVAEILGTNEQKVKYKLNLPYIKVGGKRMYQSKDIETFISKHKEYTIDISSYKKSNKKVMYVS